MDISLFILWVLFVFGVLSVAIASARYLGKNMFFGLYAGLTVVANVIAVKLIMIGKFVVPAAVIMYSATFLLTDIASELWGKKFAKRIVLTGFVTNIVAVLGIWLSVIWKAAPFVPESFVEAYKSVLGMAPRIVFASVVSYLLSQTHDVWAFHYWKDKTNGKYLWLRNNASTIVSQFIDTVVFITLAFYGTVPNNVLGNMIIGQYIAKVLIALADTPFCYLGVWLARKVADESAP